MIEKDLNELNNDHSQNQTALPEATVDVGGAVEEIKEAAPAKPDSPNFKLMRERAKQAERERDEALKKLSHYETSKPTNPEEDLDITIGADELAEGKHLSKVQKKIKKLEEKISQYEQQSTASLVEQRIRMEMPDFEKIVNEDTIALFRQSDPDMAQGIAAIPDMYTKAKMAYKMIQQSGIGIDDYEQDRGRVAKNVNKPKSLQALAPQEGESPLAQANAFANGLTPELQKQLYKEMQEAKSRA